MKHLAKVPTQGDTVHVHEHGFLTQQPHELEGQRSSLAFRVFPPVANEHCAHRTSGRQRHGSPRTQREVSGPDGIPVKRFRLLQLPVAASARE